MLTEQVTFFVLKVSYLCCSIKFCLFIFWMSSFIDTPVLYFYDLYQIMAF